MDGYDLIQRDILYLYGLQKHTLNDQRDIYSLGLGVIAENYEWFQTDLITAMPGVGSD